MPELPRKKVGIGACSGEELAAGTVTRLAALEVLERLRPGDTVTICLPLYLAGGEGDRAFARFYPTIALDGCERRCAARATEQYSARPAAAIVVSELLAGPGGHEPAAACACGGGLPVARLLIGDETVALAALPLIFNQFRDAGKAPGAATAHELLEAVRLYNPIPPGQDASYRAALERAYAAHCAGRAEDDPR
jgi:uncharacterized metal-binding protein